DVTARERIRREFDALRATAEAMATAGQLDQAIASVVSTLREHAGYERAAIWMMHPNGVELTLHRDGADDVNVIPVGEGPVGRAAATGEAVFPRVAHGPLSVVGESSLNQIAVPILSDNRVVAVIDVSGRAGSP